MAINMKEDGKVTEKKDLVENSSRRQANTMKGKSDVTHIFLINTFLINL